MGGGSNERRCTRPVVTVADADDGPVGAEALAAQLDDPSTTM
jgi:hypothetical protein